MLDVSAIRGSDSDKVRLPVVLYVLWLFGIIGVCVQGVAFADEVSQQPDEEKFRWHTRVGLQLAHQSPDFTYEPVRTSDITAWNENSNGALTSFSFVSLQRELTDDSTLEFSYHNDGVGGKLYWKKRFFIFHLRFSEPLEIELMRMKLEYSRVLWTPGQFSFGTLAGVQGFQIWMDASQPELFLSMGGDDHFDYFVMAPSLGVFAEYQTNGPVKYRVSSEWMSAPLGNVEGKLIGLNAGIDYRVTDRLFFGFGYRFFDMNIRLHQRHYDLKGSYEVHGYQLYAGFNF